MAKWFFGGQVRKKEAKFELSGLQEANLATLVLIEAFHVSRKTCPPRITKNISLKSRFQVNEMI